MSKNKVFMVVKLDSVIFNENCGTESVLEHAEHNGMKMKTSFPVLLTLKPNKKEE